jgi:hypothetical protein
MEVTDGPAPHPARGLAVAFYKYSDQVTPNDNPAFDTIHQPGATPPFAGIYRCEVCGHEIGTAGGQPLPPQTHHPHERGSITWRLIVATRS